MSLIPQEFHAFIYTVWTVYIVAIGGWILLQKRSPISTLTWILTLSFIPVLGFFIYYLFGPKKIIRHRLSRRRSRQIVDRNYAIWDPYIQSEDFPEEYKSMARLIFNITNIPLCHSMDYRLLSGGEKTYDAIFEAIRRAKNYILLEYYIFETDGTGIAMRDLLTEKLKEGVKVYLLVDALGSSRLTRNFMHDFVRAGGELGFFHNITWRRLFSLINFRNHRKIVICDGLTGFTGGVNVSDEQDLRRNANAYHDVHIQVDGPVIAWLESIFIEDWHYSTGDLSLVRALRKAERKDIDVERVVTEPGQAYRMQVIPSGPDSDFAPILRVMLSAMYRARSRIYLTTPYFVPDDASLFALTSAALRGVDVRLLVPRKSDNLVVTLATQSWYDDLIRAGIRIYEYTPRMLHTKTLVIDDDLSFIGSANFDYRSFYLNFEVSVLCYEPKANELLAREFHDSLNSSEEVVPKKQSFAYRLLTSTARLFSPLL
ncbi:MAG: cardiolipin synthase [Advenella sp.]